MSLWQYFATRDIYIWGAGRYGVLTAFDLELKGLKIAGFIDSQADKIKTRLGLKVLEPQTLKKCKNIYIFVAVLDYYALLEIGNYLESIGFIYGVDFEFSDEIAYKESKCDESLNKLDLCNSKLPLVSIIIPVYNVEKYLDKCLESIIC